MRGGGQRESIRVKESEGKNRRNKKELKERKKERKKEDSAPDF